MTDAASGSTTGKIECALIQKNQIKLVFPMDGNLTSAFGIEAVEGKA